MSQFVKSPMPQIDHHFIQTATAQLSETNPFFGHIVAQWGVPVLTSRNASFASLLHIILEQQVSLASALAVYNRLVALTGTLTPQTFMPLDDQQLKQIGFSRQKIIYGRHLALALTQGDLELDALARKDDNGVRDALMQLKGIGRWTADIYLLMVLKRTDVWPAGDLALAVSYQETLGLAVRPTQAELAVIAQKWRPVRSVAALLLWHQYLSKRGKQYPL